MIAELERIREDLLSEKLACGDIGPMVIELAIARIKASPQMEKDNNSMLGIMP